MAGTGGPKSAHEPAHADRVDRADLDRVAAADHADPHSVLGLHGSPGVYVVRAFRPDALEIRVLPDDATLPSRAMARIHPGGVFSASYPEARARFAYRLEIRYASGVFTVRDPYAFPP